MSDPTTWPRATAQAHWLGLDIGMAQDHSALVAAGSWLTGGRSVIGVYDCRQIPLGTPLDAVADLAADAARKMRARVIFDASNNSAFASLLAARMGRDPQNQMVAGVITNALDHASQPTHMALSVGGLRAGVPRWTLSKRELVETVSAEIDGGTLRIGKEGDWEALRYELLGMERTVRQSGAVAYSAPTGKHDDMVMALALAAFALRRVGASRSQRIRRQGREKPGNAAWY